MMSPESRKQNIEYMADAEFDLVIIGGGINGAGVARDAASRGMRVALVEADDFASGTSSRSSKLVHGGIRYLETFEFHLVFEALSERRKLFSLAPHLVHPLRFVLPLFKGDRVGMFKMGLGMWLYDALALFDAPEMHRRLDHEETLEAYPYLKSENLLGSYIYYDAYMDDDRLVHETLRSASRYGAKVANYVKATGAKKDSHGRMQTLICRDQLTQKEFTIKGRHFVSTVGPWTDVLAESMLTHWKKIMRPSKGIHLTLSRERFPLQDAVVMAADQQKRIIFAIPRHEMVIVGTTDTDFKADPSAVRSDANDVKYLLGIVNEYFPGAQITEQDIIASYSGVRPLVADGSATESGTSREHVIIPDPRNVTFVAGGKYTTYRAMAEETVEIVLGQWPIEEQMRFKNSQTEQPLNPQVTSATIEKAKSQVLQQKMSSQWGLSESLLHWLIERHGLEAFQVLQENLKHSTEPEWTRIWRMETRHAIETTMCLNIRDFYLRRSPLFLADPQHGFQYLDAVAEEFKNRLGFSDGQIAGQVEDLKAHLDQEMAWRIK